MSPNVVLADRTASIIFTESEILLDGKASEQAWSTATKLGEFTPFEPTTEVSPRFSVEAKALSKPICNKRK